MPPVLPNDARFGTIVAAAMTTHNFIFITTMTTHKDAAAPVFAPLQLTPEQIDKTIETYEAAVADSAVLAKRASELKAALILQVDQLGSSHAQKSKRWAGLRKSATLTYSTTDSVNEPGVSKLRAFLESKNLGWMFERFF